MSSDDEPALPAWLVEQASAQKERAHASRIADSSDEYSELDGNSDAEDTKQAAGASGESKGKEGGNAAKAKSRGRAPPSARLPLVLAPKVRRDTLLLEASDPNLDLSGDFGCIGKLHVRRSGGASASTEGDGGGGAAEPRQTLMLDLKGKVYDANLLPCNTMCLVAVDGSKAKVEAIFSDFAQLAPPRDSIFDMQEVHGGQFDADFFDDEVLSQVGDGSDDDEAVGPLREHKGGKKGGAKGKKAGGRKPASKGAGAKRKSGGGGGGPAKKARS